MEYRPLGRSEVMVPPLVFGGNVFGWTVDEAQGFRLLDALMDAGLNAIDTADVYSTWVPGHTGGESETIIGKWLKQRGRRDDVVILTKAGSDMGHGNTGLSRRWLTRAIEDSLRRLQTDYVDLYQSHRDDESTPMDETMETFARLIEQGKVRAIGASNFTAARLREALDTSARLGLPRYESLQPRYNLYSRDEYEAELEPLCEQESIGVINYSALASGFLTGKYRSEADLGQSQRGGSVKRYMDARGQRILAALDSVAARLSANPTRVALAWLIARPSVTAPIASVTSLQQLQDLVASATLSLDDGAIEELNAASAS